MKVNLMCVGVAKAGTTWLAEVLKQHPNVFIHPKKEIHYFNHFHPITREPNINRTKGHQWYNHHFEDGEKKKILADFSTSYLQNPSISSEIRDYNSYVKIMVMLRNPTERAISDFRFLYSRGLIKEKNLLQAFSKNRTIRETGNYYTLIKPFFDHFDNDRVKIIFFKQLSEPDKLLNDVCDFLEIERMKFDFELVNQNKTKYVNSTVLHNSVTNLKLSKIGQLLIRSGIGGFFNKFYDWNNTYDGAFDVDKDQLNFLKNYYYHEIRKFEALTGKRTGWLENTDL